MRTPVNFFSAYSLPCAPLLLPLLFALTTAFNAAALPSKTDGDAAAVTEDMVRSKIDALNAKQQMDAAAKTKLLENYQTALANLQTAANYRAQTKDYEQALKLAPAQIKGVKKNLEKTAAALKNAKPEAFDGIDTEELEQRLIIERGKLNDLNAELKKIEDDLSVQSTRAPKIRQENAALQEKIDDGSERLKALRGAEPKTESEAPAIQLQSLLMAQAAELKMLEAEASSNPARVELLKAKAALLTLQSDALLSSVNVLEEVLSERRQQEAERVQQELNQAEKELAGKAAVIQTVTRENIQFGKDLSIIADKIAQITSEQGKITATSNQIDKDFKSAEQKINLAGLSPALGKILREQRRNLPNLRELEAQAQELQNETAAFSFEQFRVEDKLKQVNDVNQLLKTLLREQVDASLSAPERLQIQAELRMLLNNQKDLLNKLSASYSDYLNLLGDLEFSRQQMMSLADKYAQFLDKHLLWVPSSSPVDTAFFTDLLHAAQWFLTPRYWSRTLQELLRELLTHPLLAIFAVLGLAGLFALKRQAKEKLADISEKVSKPYRDRFGYTLQAFGYSLLLIAPRPLSFYFIGWLLQQGSGLSEFSHGVGGGLVAASVPLLFLQFFYVLTYPRGIAALHLRWQESSIKLLHVLVGWLRFVAVPAVFLIVMTGMQSVTAHSDSLGRLALIAVLLALAWTLSKLLKFKGGIVERYFCDYPESWLTRLRYLWYPGIIAVPLIVTGFAMAGYYASALELEHKLVISIRIVFSAVVLYHLAVRWLLLVNRKLAVIKARQKREAEQAAKASTETADELPAVNTDEIIDIPKINAQTRQMLLVLIAFGLIVSFWLVWADILPALAILDNIVFWQQTVVIDGVETLQPVTLINLLLAGFYAFIVIMALRNLPGILEILLLKQLAVEPGNRYAINQLARYILIALGIISVANALGGSWSQIQWLVAALGVGLGFGLQEIFANLVSGIILLFERPMRVGDTITVGDLTGRVSRIQMRATTIMDPDHKELIIPNKTFITGQLVNWTLSDQVTRLVLQVGIAYGSDTRLVHKVISETVRATTGVLHDPEPAVNFTGFGETALNFSVYVFVKDLADRLPVTHALHMRIEHALRERHIELAYKQRGIIERVISVASEEEEEK